MAGDIPFAIVVRVPRGTTELPITVDGHCRLERGLLWWERKTTVEFQSPEPISVELPES